MRFLGWVPTGPAGALRRRHAVLPVPATRALIRGMVEALSRKKKRRYGPWPRDGGPLRGSRRQRRAFRGSPGSAGGRAARGGDSGLSGAARAQLRRAVRPASVDARTEAYASVLARSARGRGRRDGGRPRSSRGQVASRPETSTTRPGRDYTRQLADGPRRGGLLLVATLPGDLTGRRARPLLPPYLRSNLSSVRRPST